MNKESWLELAAITPLFFIWGIAIGFLHLPFWLLIISSMSVGFASGYFGVGKKILAFCRNLKW